MASITTGAIAGIVGALSMVPVMRMVGADADPPFAVAWAKFVGDGDPGEAMPAALILHLTYGLVAGAVFAAVSGAVGPSVGLTTAGVAGAVVWGLVWAALLLVGAMVQANAVLDMDPDPEALRSLALAHLAYGVVLGIVVALL